MPIRRHVFAYYKDQYEGLRFVYLPVLWVYLYLRIECVCWVFVWLVAVDITKMISDREEGGVSHGWFTALY